MGMLLRILYYAVVAWCFDCFDFFFPSTDSTSFEFVFYSILRYESVSHLPRNINE